MFSKLIVIAAAVLVVGVGTAAAKPTPLGLRAEGLRLQAAADRYGYLQGVKADGLRWVAKRNFYVEQSKSAAAVTGDGFSWGDAGIGAAAGLALVVVAGTAFVFVRHSRRTKLAL